MPPEETKIEESKVDSELINTEIEHKSEDQVPDKLLDKDSQPRESVLPPEIGSQPREGDKL